MPSWPLLSNTTRIITTQIRTLASKMCIDVEGSDNDSKTPN